MNLPQHLRKTALVVAMSHSLTFPALSFERDVSTIEALRTAIIDANQNDVPDTINLSQDITATNSSATTGNAIPFIYSDITINGNNYTLRRVVENDTDPANQFRIMAVFSPGGRPNNGRLVLNDITLDGGFLPSYNGGGLFVEEDASAILTNVTISGNTVGLNNQNPGGRGAGIYSKGSVSLTDSTISGNVAINGGGGIYSAGGSLTLNNTSISTNTASLSGGGGIGADDSQVRINNSTISGNSARSGDGGGGIHTVGGSLSLRNTFVTQNQVTNAGGGGLSLSNTTANLTNCTIVNNSASAGRGGGISASQSTVNLLRSSIASNSADFRAGIGANQSSVNIEDSTVNNNSAAYSGGGLTAYNQTTMTISNTTISQNVANRDGGGIVSSASDVEIKHTTISQNKATRNGAGIFADSPSVTLFNSIVANSIGFDCFTSELNVAYADVSNIIEDGSCGTEALSIDPNLGPLTDNGGPTLTHALLDTSTAINLGDNNTCNPSPISRLDQRGYLRTGACDAGAYEFGASKPPPPPPPPPFQPASIVPAVTLLLGGDED